MHPMRIYMKWETWHDLPPDIQRTIDTIGPAGADCWFAVEGGLDADRHLVEALANIRQKGELIELAPEELEKWQRLSQPTRDSAIAAAEAKGLPARKFFDRMNELVAEYG